jgi:hypothetical protein
MRLSHKSFQRSAFIGQQLKLLLGSAIIPGSTAKEKPDRPKLTAES